MGDVDGDGDADIVIGGGDSELEVLLNSGDGEFFSSPRLIFTVGSGPSFVTVINLDGQDLPELVVANGRSNDVTVLFLEHTPFSEDVNENGIPDRCELTLFHRGDSNDDGVLNLSDAINVFNVLFLGTGQISCRDAADTNDDERVNISDGAASLFFLFFRGAEPPRPGPPPAPCGFDPDGAALDCETYSGCD